MEKVCSKCKISKNKSEFRVNKSKKDGLQNYCIPCDKENQKQWYLKNSEKHREKNSKRTKETTKISRQYVLDHLKDHHCVECGEADPIVLEFHHLRDKSIGISKLISQGYSLDTLKQEMDKCEVLCANCHKRKTAKEFNWYKAAWVNG